MTGGDRGKVVEAMVEDMRDTKDGEWARLKRLLLSLWEIHIFV